VAAHVALPDLLDRIEERERVVIGGGALDERAVDVEEEEQN
jgi:hypothetical protein